MATKELQVINSVLKNKDVQALFADSVDDLFSTYRPVWDSIKGYYYKYQAVPDIEVIQERFPEVEEIDVKGSTKYYLDELKSDHIEYVLGNLIKGASKDLNSSNAAMVLEKLQQKMSALNRFSSSAKDTNIMDLDEAERRLAEVRERAEARGGTPGIPTGISFIDSAYPTGLSGGQLIVILGWTGRGKSQFATLLSCNAHRLSYKPMIASLEMPAPQVQDRVLTIMGKGAFRNSHLSVGDVDVDNFRTFKAANSGKSDFIVVESNGLAELTPNMMQAKIDQHKPGMVTFDYAQLGADNENSRDMTARMRNMSSQYKRLAVANDIPVILISSATPDNGSAPDSPPTIEQVAWSKQLAYDADLAFAVHKHTDSDIIEIVCRKNRNGPLFDGYLEWDIDQGIIEERFDL